MEKYYDGRLFRSRRGYPTSTYKFMQNERSFLDVSLLSIGSLFVSAKAAQAALKLKRNISEQLSWMNAQQKRCEVAPHLFIIYLLLQIAHQSHALSFYTTTITTSTWIYPSHPWLSSSGEPKLHTLLTRSKSVGWSCRTRLSCIHGFASRSPVVSLIFSFFVM